MLPSAFWLIALIVLLVGEAITIGLTFVWFAVGALGALIVAVLGGALWLQVVIFLALSGVTLALARPVFARFLKTSHAATNADRVIGQTAVGGEQDMLSGIRGRQARLPHCGKAERVCQSCGL